MAKRRARWAILFVLLVVLSFLGIRQVLRSIPDRLRAAERMLADQARALGLEVSFRDLRFHPAILSVSLDNLVVRDAAADTTLLLAERVDLSLSLRGMVSGGSPVSRVRVRNFSIRFDEKNRSLLDRFRSGQDAGSGSRMIPEIRLLDGTVEAGPIGPLVRGTVHLRQLGIRDRGSLGRQVTVIFDGSEGRVILPGGEPAEIPIDSGAIEFVHRGEILRVRNLRLSGPALSLRGSGLVDVKNRSATFKAAGRGDLGKWIEAGGAGRRQLARVAASGQVDFSVSATGTPERPEGSATLVLHEVRLPGGIPVGGELAATLSDRILRVDLLRGSLWGGTLGGKGELDLARGEGRGTLSLNGARLGKAPWEEWGVGWRPSGSGSVRVDVSGTRERVAGSVVLDNPGGLERPGDSAARILLPLSGRLEMVLAPWREIRAEKVRFLAGGAELFGSGRYGLTDRSLRWKGTLSVPGGSASSYGWKYPVSWGQLEGAWEVAGEIDRLHLKGEARIRDLSARSLPPLSATLKFEGDPGEAVHFAADCPADVARVTATGTLSGPLSPGPFLLNASVIARSIDLSRAGSWAAAVLRSLGRDPASVARHADRLAGTASADLQLSVGGGDLSISGTLGSEKIRAFGADARTVSFSGGWRRDGSVDSWKIRVSGEMGGGKFLATGAGRGPEGTLFGSGERVDLGWAISLLKPELDATFAGKADLDVAARTGTGTWNIDRFSLSVPRLLIRRKSPPPGNGGALPPVALENVVAEGSLGDRSGAVRVTVASPRTTIRADLTRRPDWPASVSVAVDNVWSPFLSALAGRADSGISGTWTVRGEGEVRLGLLAPAEGSWTDAVTRMTLSVAGTSVGLSGLTFADMRVSGVQEGDLFRGEVETRNPDSRLACSLSLRDPFRFGIEGPFSLRRTDGNGGGGSKFSLEGEVRAAGQLGRPERTTGSLSVRRLSFRGAGIDLAGEDLSLRFEPAGIRWEGGSLRAEGNPVQVSGAATWNGELDLRLGGKLPAATARLATDIFDRLDGTVQVQLRITGRWDDPSLVGTGRLEEGTLSFRGYAQLFEEMTADLVLSRERIVFEDFAGRSGGGYLDGSGEVPLQYDKGQRLFFSVDFFDMRYPYPEDLHPVVQGHVDLFGPPDDLLISGDVEVQSALYTKPVRLEKALLDFRRRLANVTARRKESDFRIRLDIDGVADGTIRVRNNLGEAQAKGEFKVAGDTGRVILLGSFDGIDGHVEYRGNRYEVTRLNIDFQDPLRINPRIDARAETKKGNVNVIVSVTGTLEKIEVEFSSDPPLSKNDIVALLSLGVTTENLVGAEGSLSAAEAASIALGPYKGRVEEEIRGIAGLDKFTIEPSFSSTDKSFEPRFTVGKSFGERFSVSVSTSVGASAESSAAAELQVFENVFLQGNWESGTADKEGDIGGDVRFRYRYRQFRDIFHGGD